MRLGIFVTHPIQYFAPLWRRLAATKGLELHVFFFSDHSVRGGVDPGFGVPVAWDVPILDGYLSTFLSRNANLDRPWTVQLPNAERVLDEARLDAVLVHGYTHRFELQVIRAAKRTGRRTVLRGELTDASRPETRSFARTFARRLYLRWFFEQVDAFCYVGTRARRYLEGRGTPPNRMFRSPYSVDTELFEAQRNQSDREESRRRLGIPPDDVVVLFSGKLVPRKNPLLLLEAFSCLPEREGLTLVCLGDGEQRGEVERQARDLLGTKVLLPGFVNQSRIGQYFAAADIFVLPSVFETWGLVVNEALQFGLPVICSNTVGSSDDLVKEGETGFVFPSGDAAALAAAIQRLRSDPALRRSMAANARRLITGFSTQASAEGILQAVQASGREEVAE